MELRVGNFSQASFCFCPLFKSIKYENILKRSLPSDDLFFLSCAIISFLLKYKRRNVYVDLSFQNACFSQILSSEATLTDYYRVLIKFCVFSMYVFPSSWQGSLLLNTFFS